MTAGETRTTIRVGERRLRRGRGPRRGRRARRRCSARPCEGARRARAHARRACEPPCGTRSARVRGAPRRGARRRGGQAHRGRGVLLAGCSGRPDFTRSDAVVGVGGGAITDLAGFVAAHLAARRAGRAGADHVLGMVDAAVGGKTGINTDEGKNLVGVFHPPAAVLCDLDAPRDPAAQRDPRRVRRDREGRLHPLPRDPRRDRGRPRRRATDPDLARVPPRRRARDPHEGRGRLRGLHASRALREILNYGHTLGHAIEHAERYQWRHGAAISVGMAYAAELGRLAGRLSDEVADRHQRVLDLLGLPTTYPADRWDTLLATMRRDKKARGGTAALHRARRPRQAHRDAGARPVAAVRGVPGDRLRPAGRAGPTSGCRDARLAA